MAETASKTVTEHVAKVNNNMVKIALDEYNELLRKASRPITNNVTYMQKTAEQAAKDNFVYGVCIAVVGVVTALAGGGLAAYGWKSGQ